MDQFQRRRRRARARDVLRTMRRAERALAEAKKPIDRAEDVLAAIGDSEASRRRRKIKEPPVD
jgi:hypothetical protein